MKKGPKFIYKEKLSNGLIVLIHEMPWAQSVTARLVVKAGPRYENKKNIGTAHYLEHMLLEGSSKYPTRKELDKAIEIQGGTHNAYTNKEYVMYQIKMPPESASLTLKFLYEIVFHPLISNEAVLREKGIISEELRMSLDNPNNHIWNLLLNFAWKNHPLGYNTLGTFDSIQALTKNDLMMYHQTFYVPNNAILIISGNIETRKALDMVMKEFNKLKKKGSFQSVSTPKLIVSMPRVHIEESDIKQSHILLSFSTQSYGKSSSLSLAIQLLSELNSKNIFYRLVYDLGLSYSAYCWPWLFSDTGLIAIYAGTNSKHTEKVVETIVHEVNNLKINKKNVHEAKASLKKNLTLDLADSDDYAHFIGEQQLFKNNVYTPEEIKDKIDTVSIDTLIYLKNFILKKNNATMVVLGPVLKKATLLEKKLKTGFKSVPQKF